MPYKNHRTFFTNHMGSISHHMTPLVNNSLGGRHTQTRLPTFADKVILRNQARAGQREPGLKVMVK